MKDENKTRAQLIEELTDLRRSQERAEHLNLALRTIRAVNQSIVNDIRLDVATNMLRLDMKFFDKRQTGELLSRLANDVALSQRSLSLLLRRGAE